jgi:hypothetical protein
MGNTWMMHSGRCVSAAKQTRTGPASPPVLGVRVGGDVLMVVHTA